MRLRHYSIMSKFSGLENLLGRLKRKLGPLGWSSLVVFVIFRCADLGTILYKVLLGRWLDPLDFGAIEPFVCVVGVIGLPITVMFQIGAKSVSRLHAMGRTGACGALIKDILKITALGSALALSVVIALRDFILTRLHLDSVVYIWVFCLVAVLSWWQPLYAAIIQGTGRFKLMMIPSLAPLLMLMLGFVFVALFEWGLPGALLARTGSGIITIITVFLCLRPFISVKRESYADEIPIIKSTAFPMLLFFVGVNLLGQFDQLFVRNFLLADSGGYAALITLGAVSGHLISPITFVIFPIAAGEHATGGDVRRFCRQSLFAGLAITTLCAAGFAVFGRLFMRVLWKETFVSYAPYVWLYAVVMGLHTTVMTIALAEMARHRYGVIWLIGAPTLIMCGMLYVYRASASIIGVLIAMTAATAAALAAVTVYALMERRGD